MGIVCPFTLLCICCSVRDYMTEKNTKIPLYMQVKSAIISRIESGEIAADDSAGSESELMKEFGVSQITVRRALSELVAEGYLYRLRGKGTYVSGRQNLEDTRSRIRRAVLAYLEQYPVSELTAESLCKVTDIDSATLYRNYFSLSDVLKDLSRSELFGRSLVKAEGRSWVEVFGDLLLHFYDHRKVFLNLYESVYSDILMEAVRGYGEVMIKQGIEDSAVRCGVQIKERDRQFMLAFYLCVYMGVIREYFDSRMTECPEYMISRFRIMLSDTMDRTLLLLDKERK